MTLTVIVEESNGQFNASLVGSLTLHAVRASRGEAIAALERELAEKIAAGELIDLDFRLGGVAALSGMFRDDPVLKDICNEIYSQRDAERPDFS